MFEDKGIGPGAPDEDLFELTICTFGEILPYYNETEFNCIKKSFGVTKDTP
jgi:hypothetical protein